MGLVITALFGFVSGILSYGLFVPADLRVCPGSCCFLTELSEHEAN
jgi:hypothetical protein